jgi:hypothetical protein
MRRAAVGQVVAIDRGDDYMLQAKPRDRLGDSARFVDVQRTHLAVRDRTVRAITRAHVAHQHEGGRAMRKAFADIRTARFLANRMQLELAENRLGPKVLRRNRRAHFDPVRMLPLSHRPPSTQASRQLKKFDRS